MVQKWVRLLKSTVQVNDNMWNFNHSILSNGSDIEAVYRECGAAELDLDDERVRIIKERYLPLVLQAAQRVEDLKKWRIMRGEQAKIMNQEFGKRLKAIEKEFIDI